jgi:NADH-quinone oxidoreductase subunit N
VTVADLWAAMPLVILSCGSLTVLLLGAVAPGRYGTVTGIAASLGATLWVCQPPLAVAAGTLGIASSPFARFFTALLSLTAAAVLLLSDGYNRRRGIIGEELPATILFATFGMAVVASATNLLILFLGLEALTFAFYILVASDRKRLQSAEAGMKYLLLGALAAAFIAFGIALIYTRTGSLAIAHAMASSLPGWRENPLALAGWGFLLTGLAFKISLVPAHLWTPDVYEGGPPPVIAFLSTASKVASIAFFLLLLPAVQEISLLHVPLRGLAFLSMTVGNLAALLQKNIKRMLAYSAIGQMGYVTLALLSGKGGGYEAAAFYAVAYTVMNLAAFGAVASFSGAEELGDVASYRGAGYSHPVTGGVLALAMLALAGIPPTAGFIGKFLIFTAALRSGETSLAIIGILTAIVSVYFYLQVVVNLYARPEGSPAALPPVPPAEAAVLCTTGLAIICLGIMPGPLIDLLAGMFP